jgi:hypothetical protein
MREPGFRPHLLEKREKKKDFEGGDPPTYHQPLFPMEGIPALDIAMGKLDLMIMFSTGAGIPGTFQGMLAFQHRQASAKWFRMVPGIP